MIEINLPIFISNECVLEIKKELDRLVKYDTQYLGIEFYVHRMHISLLNINGNLDRGLKSHIESMIERIICTRTYERNTIH